MGVGELLAELLEASLLVYIVEQNSETLDMRLGHSNVSDFEQNHCEATTEISSTNFSAAPYFEMANFVFKDARFYSNSRCELIRNIHS